MKKSVFAILACTSVVLFAGCGIGSNDGAASSGGNVSEQIVEANNTEEQDIDANIAKEQANDANNINEQEVAANIAKEQDAEANNTEEQANDADIANEQSVDANNTDEQDDSEIQESSSELPKFNLNLKDVFTEKEVNVVWRYSYNWAMGGDIFYVDSDGKIYEEGEVENPMWTPSGACDETYTGKQFTQEELNELLNIEEDDEQSKIDMLRKKGIKVRDH